MFRIKICGIVDSKDATQAVAAGADAVGLNFYPASRRFIAAANAKAVVQVIPDGFTKVGVFVNATVDHILATARTLKLDFIQLHGDEPPDRLLDLAPYPVIRAFRCRKGATQPVLDFLAKCRQLGCEPAALLIDAYDPHLYGGTGKTAPWEDVRRLVDNVANVPVVLAGGLHPDNIRQAIQAVRPSAVDVAGGVERRAGGKDPLLMRRFVTAAKSQFTTIDNNG